MAQSVYVKQIELKIDDNASRMLYEVQYIKRFWDGYGWCNLWSSYGVYEDEVIANFVAKKIYNGEIEP